MSLYVLCPRCGVMHRSDLSHQCVSRKLAPAPLRRSSIPSAVGFALVIGSVIAAFQWLLGLIQ